MRKRRMRSRGVEVLASEVECAVDLVLCDGRSAVAGPWVDAGEVTSLREIHRDDPSKSA